MNLRFLLYPFSILYGIITYLRNKFFDWRILKSTFFDFPVVCVGNLSMGGTGKTPMTHYLLHLLAPGFCVAVLSRGYGRATRGFVLADSQSTAKQIGDEPFTYFRAFYNPEKKITVAVCEDRVEGINRLLQAKHELNLVLLDDAFQHRSVKAGLNILLTEFSKLYVNDLMLPAGTLREFASGAARADIIVVTKCPHPVSEEKKNQIRAKLKIKTHQHLFFSFLNYGDLINPVNGERLDISAIRNHEVVLITGIANPKPLKKFLAQKSKSVHHISHSDHHAFSVADVLAAKQLFDTIATAQKIIVTTEKDFARLMSNELQQHISKLPLFIQPVTFDFDEPEKTHFNKLITDYARQNKTNR